MLHIFLPKQFALKLILTGSVILLNIFYSVAADEWKSYFNNHGVEVMFRYADCHDIPNGLHQQKILLRFANYGEKPVVISFSKALTFSNSGAQPDVRDFTVHLNGGEIIQPDCDTKDNRLWIFSKQLNFKSTHLKHFELQNITVKTVQ